MNSQKFCGDINGDVIFVVDAYPGIAVRY